jgi:hypothetical protein
MELLVLIAVILAAVALVILASLATEMLAEGGWVGLLINTVVGVLLLFGTNLVVSPPIPINIITLLICAIGGVAGWLIIMVLISARDSFLRSRVTGFYSRKLGFREPTETEATGLREDAFFSAVGE